MKTFSVSDLDEINRNILDESLLARKSLKGPQVGDYLWCVSNTIHRISVIHNQYKEIQCGKDGSFNLTEDGLCDHSGASLFNLIKIKDIEPTNEYKKGSVCFFSHGKVKADNLISVSDVNFKVWKVIGEAKND